MATAEFSASVGLVRASAASANLIGSTVAASAAAASGGTDGAAFTTALATLVADGASPTQAHVTAVNSAWTTYKADIDAATAAAAAITADASLYIGNVATMASMDKLRNVLREFERIVASSDLLAAGSAHPRTP